MEAEERFPFTTLPDARTFADYWVEADVLAEEFGKPEGGDPHEGFVSRSITLAVTATLWRNGEIGRSDEVPARFDLEVIGHSLHEGKSAPLVITGAPYLSVGQHYLLGLVHDPDGLALPSPRAVFRVADGTITGLDQARPDETIADDLDGMTPERAVATVVAAPLLVADQSLTPNQRLDQLLREEE